MDISENLTCPAHLPIFFALIFLIQSIVYYTLNCLITSTSNKLLGDMQHLRNILNQNGCTLTVTLTIIEARQKNVYCDDYHTIGKINRVSYWNRFR